MSHKRLFLILNGKAGENSTWRALYGTEQQLEHEIAYLKKCGLVAIPYDYVPPVNGLEPFLMHKEGYRRRPPEPVYVDWHLCSAICAVRYAKDYCNYFD